MSPDDLRDAVYARLQQHYGSQPVVSVEDLVRQRCGHAHISRLRGVRPSSLPPGPEVLLQEVALETRRQVGTYLRGALPGRFREGEYRSFGPITARIDGYLDDALVEISPVSTDAFHPSAEVVLTALTKAHLLGLRRAIVILLDRNTQSWSFWQLESPSGFEDVCADVLDDMRSLEGAVHRGAPLEPTGSQQQCRACPYEPSCTGSVRTKPAHGTYLSPEPALWLKILMDGYLWGRNNKPHHRATNVIHPSEISTTPCDRRIAYGLLGEKEHEAVDPKLRRIFDVGKCFHDLLQSVLKDLLPGFKEEAEVRHAQLRMQGHCDGVWDRSGVEIKSIGRSGFDALSRGPKPGHEEQATIYGALLELENIYYVYANKETGELRVYRTAVNRDLWQQIAGRSARIVQEVSEGRLPPQIESKSVCGRCKYAHACKPEEAATTTPERRMRRFK